LEIQGFSIKLKGHSVRDGVFCQGKYQIIGTHHTARGCPKPAYYSVPHPRFDTTKARKVQDLYRYPIQAGVVFLGPEFFHSFRFNGKSYKAVPVKGNIQFCAELIEHAVPQNIEMSLTGTRKGIMTGVDHGGITFAGSAANIGTFFQNQNSQGIPG
jgi:hypothetical protein